MCASELDGSRRSPGQPADLPHELGDRGGRGRDQARALRDRAAVRDRRSIGRSTDVRRERVAHREQGEVPHRTSDRCCPASYHTFFGDFEYLEQVLFKRLVSPTEVAAIVVESWLGEGGYVLPPDGWFRTCASSATGTGSCWSATRCSRAWAAPARCGRSSTRASSPTSCSAGKGIASGLPLGAMIAREDLMTLGARRRTARPTAAARSSCAAALATFDVIEDEGLLENARDGRRDLARRAPRDRGTPPDRSREVRGRGLMDRHRVRRPPAGAARSSRPRSAGAAGARLRRRRDPDLAAAGVPRGPGRDRPRDLRGGRRRGRGGDRIRSVR